MSVKSKIEKLSQELRQVGLTPVKKVGDTKGNKQTNTVADSWEDETSDSDDGSRSPMSEQSAPLEAPGPTHLKSPTSRAVDAQRELDGDIRDLPSVPPPTPISPSMMSIKPDWSPPRGLGGNNPISSSVSSFSSLRSTPPILSSNPTPRHGTPEPSRTGEQRRPEKTTATANRLIAGALGIRAPPKTEEQRKYERAIKEQEIKRRNKEKEQKAKEAEEDEQAKVAMWTS